MFKNLIVSGSVNAVIQNGVFSSPEEFCVEERGNTVVIKSANSNSIIFNGNKVIITGSSSMTIIGDNVITEQSGNDDCENKKTSLNIGNKIKDIDMSGSTTLVIEDSLPIKEIDLSGSANLKIGTLNNDSVEIDTSGASKVTIDNLSCEDLEIDTSGASKVKVNGSTDHVYVDSSGASKVVGNLKYKNKKEHTSGIAKVKLS